MRHISVTEYGGNSVLDVQLYNAIKGGEFIEVFIQNSNGFSEAIELKKSQLRDLVKGLNLILQEMEN